MPYANSVKFIQRYAKNIYALDEKVKQETKNILSAHEHLFSKTNPWSLWVPFVLEKAQDTLISQQPIVEELRSHSNALVVVGIGGSLLGAKALYEAFLPEFPLSSSKSPKLFWAGHHLSPEYLEELCLALNEVSPSIVVISKSGGTTEPALAFRVLKEYLEKRFGEEETKKRIVVITDPQKGSLRELATKQGYASFPVPEGIGGRYSVFTAAGLFPLAFAGFPCADFVRGAQEMFLYHSKATKGDLEKSNAVVYAAIRNVLYQLNYKVEALCSWSPKTQGIAEWWKQLFGESDGKNHTGLFPASAVFSTDLHSLGQYFQEGQRHLFATHLTFAETSVAVVPPASHPDGFDFLTDRPLAFVQQKAQEGTFLAHSKGGMPVFVWEIAKKDAYCLGVWMYTNMLACALGGLARGIDPFNQPGVEAYKEQMFALMGK